jgi:hypothetical protein
MDSRTWAKGRLTAGRHGFSWFVLPTVHVFRLPRQACESRTSVLFAWLCFSFRVTLGRMPARQAAAEQGGVSHAAK